MIIFYILSSCRWELYHLNQKKRNLGGSQNVCTFTKLNWDILHFDMNYVILNRNLFSILSNLVCLQTNYCFSSDLGFPPTGICIVASSYRYLFSYKQCLALFSAMGTVWVVRYNLVMSIRSNLCSGLWDLGAWLLSICSCQLKKPQKFLVFNDHFHPPEQTGVIGKVLI